MLTGVDLTTELRDTLADVLACWEEECEWGGGIHEDHAERHAKAVSLLNRLGLEVPKSKAFRQGYEKAIEQFEATDSEGYPEFRNPYGECTAAFEGFETGVRDLTK